MRSKYEIKAHKELEKEGYLVDYKARPSYLSKYPKDYFNSFDILAYKKGEPLRFISIKGHAGVPKAHRDLVKSFKFGEGVQKEIWIYRIHGGVKKEIIK